MLPENSYEGESLVAFVVTLVVHSQIHDFEVEHVVRPAFVLLVSLQSTYNLSPQQELSGRNGIETLTPKELDCTSRSRVHTQTSGRLLLGSYHIIN